MNKRVSNQYSEENIFNVSRNYRNNNKNQLNLNKSEINSERKNLNESFNKKLYLSKSPIKNNRNKLQNMLISIKRFSNCNRKAKHSK